MCQIDRALVTDVSKSYQVLSLICVSFLPPPSESCAWHSVPDRVLLLPSPLPRGAGQGEGQEGQEGSRGEEEEEQDHRLSRPPQYPGL